MWSVVIGQDTCDTITIRLMILKLPGVILQLNADHVFKIFVTRVDLIIKVI